MPLNKLHFIIVEQNTHNYLSHFNLFSANYRSNSLWNLQHISDPSSLFLFLSFSLLWVWNVHMWKKGQTWLSFYRCHPLCFMRRGLLLPWVSPGTVGTNRGSQGPACLYYSRAEITRFAILLCLASLFFHMDLGD